MEIIKRTLQILLAILLVLTQPARAADELLVSAAASLSSAFSEIGQNFAAANPGTKVSFNFAASGNLLQQIERGAPVDVFASADPETMDLARDKGLIVSESRRDFASNRLVLIVPAAATLAIARPADLEKPEVKRIAIGNPAVAPFGRYTRDALGATAFDALKPKFIYAETVRQAMHYAARGEVDGAFVYASDAASAADKVRVVATLPTTQPITYPVAVVAASKQQPLAQRFVDYLLKPQAQAVLKRYGFGG